MTIVNLEYDDEGNLILPLSDEICKEAGWEIGDTIEWIDNGDGSWTMRKVDMDKEWVLVDTVSMFRMRYMVEVPKGKAEYALDTVACNDAKEFSQEHIGETIVSHRVVTEEEALAISDTDNDYAKAWAPEDKIKAFFTKEGEVNEYK